MNITLPLSVFGCQTTFLYIFLFPAFLRKAYIDIFAYTTHAVFHIDIYKAAPDQWGLNE